MHGGDEKCNHILARKLKGRDHMEELGRDYRIILKRILKKWHEEVEQTQLDKYVLSPNRWVIFDKVTIRFSRGNLFQGVKLHLNLQFQASSACL